MSITSRRGTIRGVHDEHGNDVRADLHAFGLARDGLRLALARRAAVSSLDLHALEHIEERGAVTPGELQGLVGLSSGAVTGLIDRLEQAGWVRRVPNPGDRRSVLVSLSDAAATAGGAPLAAYHRTVDDIVDRMTADERAAVSEFLRAAAVAATAAGTALARG